MPDLHLVGGTVVTADGSFRADVVVRDGRIAALGLDLPPGSAEVVDVAGRLVMPGFIDAHTHMDMPFGGTVTADNWDTGTRAALAGGTTTIVDFALQEPGRGLVDAVEAWHAKAAAKTRIDYGLHVAITDLTDAVKREIAELPAHGVCTVKLFMAYKGTTLFTADEDLFEVLQLAPSSGVLVMVHAENGDVIGKLQAQALARGDVDPIWHARTRPAGVEAEATDRAIRLAEIADAPLAVVHVTCSGALDAIRRARERGRTVYAETCPQYLVLDDSALARPDFEGAKFVCSPPLRDARNQEPLWGGLRMGDLLLVGSDHCSFDFAGQKELGRGDFTKIPNGMPGVEERPFVLWTHGVGEGRISPEQFVAALSTNQARVHGMYPRKGVIAPGADADLVVWDPGRAVSATQSNRHGDADYTPYEGMAFTGGPERVYVRGRLAFHDGAVRAEPGSGRFVERAFDTPGMGPAVR